MLIGTQINFNPRVETLGGYLKAIVKEYDKNLSIQQKKVLKGVSFTLNENYEKEMYKGGGCGFVEFDKGGHIVDILYIEKYLLDKYVDDEDFDIIPIINTEHSLKRYKELITSRGSREPNIIHLDFDKNHLKPLFLQNGSMRLLVNFTCNQLCRF